MKATLKFLTVLSLIFFISCGNNKKKKEEGVETKTEASSKKEEKSAEEITQASTYVDLENKGVGPIDHVDLDDEIDQEMAAAGKEVYQNQCLACHKPDKKFIGPPPKNILERRTPEWVMNMILNPEKMVEEDPLAKALLQEFNGSPMANQGLTEKEAREVLEYFRTL